MGRPRLHPDMIEQVRQAADIVDVIAEHVVLKKQGRGYSGCCPFHDDKSPSFSVNVEKQFYYCFGCGAGGNVFKFLMEHQQRSFADVVLDLAQRYQVPIRTLESDDQQALKRSLSHQEKLFDVLAIATQFYQRAFYNPDGRQALDYVSQTRQLNEETIQQFQLGYAPAGWQTLFDFLVTQRNTDAELVEQAGLIVPRKNGNGYYDRFRDRLMIPIHDSSGRVVGFGSRTLTGEEPKYLNSPETELFNKGKLLFGLDKARKAIVQADQAIVVEGYFDAIALQAAGIKNVVASMGTALTTAQIRQILRYTDSKQIVLNFDADSAGQAAAERAIGEVEELAYRGDVQLRILNLPNGKDADEFLQEQSVETYEILVAEAPLWLDWLIEGCFLGKDLTLADQFQQVSEAIAKILGKLPNAAVRTHYIHHCAGKLSLGDARMALQLEEDLRKQVGGQRWLGKSKKWQRPAEVDLQEAAEGLLLRIYLHCPEVRADLKQVLEEREIVFGLTHHRFLWRMIIEIESKVMVIDQPEVIAGASEDQVSEEFDLIAKVRNLWSEFPTEIDQIQPLLSLDEKTYRDIYRPTLVIRAAAACLERISCAKRCRHLSQMWIASVQSAKQMNSEQPLLDSYLKSVLDNASDELTDLLDEEESVLADLEALQRNYYQEKQSLQRLDQERCFSLNELMRLV